jgi:alpha-galactosidase
MPISAAIGYVDAMRVSCDVAPYWLPNLMDRMLNTVSGIETRGAIRNSMTRAFMDKSFWINDPDCLMLRTVNTQLTKEERRSLYNLIMTVGGLLVTSDDFGLYGENELKNLRNAIEIFKSTHKGKARVLDILSGKLPELLSNSAGFISLFNFSDQPVVKTLSEEILASAGFTKRRIVRNLETGERFDLAKPAEIPLGTHDSAMFKIEG